MTHSDRVLIMTPVKDAAHHVQRYLRGLFSLSYPRQLLSLAFLESDSTDNTYELLAQRTLDLSAMFRRVVLFKRDFGFHLPPNQPRYAHHLQVQRRTVLAKSRNQLLFRALEDEEWVLWLDVDVIEYPPDVVQRMLATGKEIVTPHCVTRYGGGTFDWNAWRDKGAVRMDMLRDGPELVRL